jgi:flagellar biosynthesis protein FlhB
VSRTTSQLHQLQTIAAIAIARAVSTVLRLLHSPNTRSIAGAAALCVGLTVQVGLLFLAMYLIDLSVSLFQLWADLARKHLELTL